MSDDKIGRIEFGQTAPSLIHELTGMGKGKVHICDHTSCESALRAAKERIERLEGALRRLLIHASSRLADHEKQDAEAALEPKRE